MEYLLTFHGKARDAPIPQPKPISQKQEFSLPPRNADDRRVFAYLRKRGIAAQVIRQFLNAGLLYEDAVHHNCVFVGRDESGQAKYAGLRGTYDLDGPGFKGDTPGSDKNTGFSLPHDPRSDLVLVFEAPIDLMSYLTLHRDTTNAVALCGLYDGALQTYLQAHPEIRSIALCLDADELGRKRPAITGKVSVTGVCRYRGETALRQGLERVSAKKDLQPGKGAIAKRTSFSTRIKNKKYKEDL